MKNGRNEKEEERRKENQNINLVVTSNLSACIFNTERSKTKGVWWMPWDVEAMKDVA